MAKRKTATKRSVGRKTYQTPTAFAVRGVTAWYLAVKDLANFCGAPNLNEFVDTLVREKAKARDYPREIPARMSPPSPRKTLGKNGE
jgi:hypothetical protein